MAKLNLKQFAKFRETVKGYIIYLRNLFIAVNAFISLFFAFVSFGCFFSFCCFIMLSFLIYEFYCFGLKLGVGEGGGGGERKRQFTKVIDY